MHNYFKLIVGLLLAVLLFSCKSPYKLVHDDAYRTKSERDLLVDPCRLEFPCKPGDPTTITTGVDSALYRAALDAFGQQIDQNLIQQDSIIALINIIKQAQGGLTTDQVDQLVKASRIKDSTTIIKNFLRWYKPAPIIKYETRDVPYLDTAKLYAANLRADNCQTNEQKLEVQVSSLKPWKLRFWLAIGIFGLLVILLILYLINRQRRLALVTKKLQAHAPKV